MEAFLAWSAILSTIAIISYIRRRHAPLKDQHNRRIPLAMLDPNGDYLTCPSTGKCYFPIVGESFYRRNFETICGERTPDGKFYENESALISPDDDNPHDSNAVAVSLEGLQVGHLSRPDAENYRKIAGTAKTKCGALVTGGWSDGASDTGHFCCNLDFNFTRLKTAVAKRGTQSREVARG